MSVLFIIPPHRWSRYSSRQACLLPDSSALFSTILFRVSLVNSYFSCIKIQIVKLTMKYAGTPEERGLVAWEAQFAKDSDTSDESCYDIPFVMGLIRK